MKVICEYKEPSPFSLFDINFVFNKMEILEKDYWYRYTDLDKEKEFEKVVNYLKKLYGSNLFYIGICGSVGRGETPDLHSDIDVIAIVEKVFPTKQKFNADIKVISKEDLSKFLLLGDSDVTNFFMESKSFLVNNFNVDEYKKILPDIKSAINYLTTKSKFSQMNCDILFSIWMKLVEIEKIDKDNQEEFENVRRWYMKEAVKYLFYAMTEIAEAQYVKEKGLVARIGNLFDYIKNITMSDYIDELFKARKMTSYNTGTLGAKEFEEIKLNTCILIGKFQSKLNVMLW